MTVTVERLLIGDTNGPTVYLCVRRGRVGDHLIVEEMPDSVTTHAEAAEWAADRWRVSVGNVQISEPQVVALEE